MQAARLQALPRAAAPEARQHPDRHPQGHHQPCGCCRSSLHRPAGQEQGGQEGQGQSKGRGWAPAAPSVGNLGGLWCPGSSAGHSCPEPCSAGESECPMLQQVGLQPASCCLFKVAHDFLASMALSGFRDHASRQPDSMQQWHYKGTVRGDRAFWSAYVYLPTCRQRPSIGYDELPTSMAWCA